MLLQAFVVGTQANRFAFFSIFQTHRVYIYVYYLLAQSIITVCVFHYYTQVSAERREAIEKKLHQFKSPQCKHQLCSIFENSMSNSKKIHSYFVMFLKLCSDHYCSDTIAPIYWFKDCYFTQHNGVY